MLTRLEVSGFKNLLDFDVELGPYTCIAGPNGSGKSNVFDAIAFLAHLADTPLMEAAHRVRTTEGRGGGDVRALFWSDGEDQADTMRFAVEMIVAPRVVDDFGREANTTTTFLRYELELRYEPPSSLASLGRLVLVSEELRHIKHGEAASHLRWPHSKKLFRDNVVTGRRSGVAFISTVTEQNVRTIQDFTRTEAAEDSPGRHRRRPHHEPSSVRPRRRPTRPSSPPDGSFRAGEPSRSNRQRCDRQIRLTPLASFARTGPTLPPRSIGLAKRPRRKVNRLSRSSRSWPHARRHLPTSEMSESIGTIDESCSPSRRGSRAADSSRPGHCRTEHSRFLAPVPDVDPRGLGLDLYGGA